MKVNIIYTGRSGRFKHGKAYNTTFTSYGRRGSRSPSNWVFTLNGWFNNYRVTQYEFRKFWKFKDANKIMVLILYDIYMDDKDYMKDLVYAKNPLLKMIGKNQFKGAYYPVPLVYGLHREQGMTVFKTGTKLKFGNKVAYVMECINKSSNPNKCRYYIDCDGWRYSVTESELQEYN